MAFTVANPDTPKIVHSWPVVVQTAVDGGKVRKDEIMVDYRVLLQDEIDDVLQAARESGENEQCALLRNSVVSIAGRVDETGQPIPFNEESLSDALNRVNERMAMMSSFYDVHNGRKAVRKN